MVFKMTKRLSFTALCLFASISVSISSLAWAIPVKPSTQLDAVETILEKAKALDNKAEFMSNSRAIEEKVDFATLTREALGDNAGKLNAAQKTEIQNLLRRIITKTVYPEAPKFFRDVAINYTNQESTPKGTHITSVVTKGTRRSTVDFWISNENKVVDLAVDGESWVDNLRSQFDEIISRKGAKDLISRMKKRLKELNEKRDI